MENGRTFYHLTNDHEIMVCFLVDSVKMMTTMNSFTQITVLEITITVVFISLYKEMKTLHFKVVRNDKKKH